MSVLVTGGAGYIGSVVVDQLIDAGREVVVLDDLSHGHADAVNPSASLVEGSIGDRHLVESLVSDGIDVCMHFAGLIAVGESVAEPAKYWSVNVAQTVALLDTLVAGGVGMFVFSSTAAAYGEPRYTPIDEDHPIAPTSPYGNSKVAVEHLLGDLDSAGRMRSVALRYFNAAGATARRTERHDPETHLIPLAIAAARGERTLKVFGDDYPTPDGTCVRDYIHVSDLADAHLRALDHLATDGESSVFNLGNGSGYSVLQVIESVERVSGRRIPAERVDRRPGDPAVLVASSDRARDVLGWQPSMPDLDEIVASAWS